MCSQDISIKKVVPIYENGSIVDYEEILLPSSVIEIIKVGERKILLHDNYEDEMAYTRANYKKFEDLPIGLIKLMEASRPYD